jgi:hypothetical protein
MLSTRNSLLATLAICGWLAAAANAATYVKVADEWGTIQPAGPRTGNNGIRGWNIEGGQQSNPAFASAGTLRFNMAGLASQLDTAFPGGWQVNNVTLVVEHFDAAFSLAGSVSIFHITNDTIPITNGVSVADPPPSDFTALGVSDLRYVDTATVGGQPVRLQLSDMSAPELGTVTKVNEYDFAAQGSGNLDVFGTPEALVNPADAINATPDYSLSFPTVNPEDTIETFATELTADAGDWSAGGLSTIASDIESGTDALSFIFAATNDNSTVAATYNGSVNATSVRYPPRIYLDVTAATSAGVLGDYNGNGIVDGADYVQYRNGGALQNEVATIGSVTPEDYTEWRSRFGNTSGSGSSLGASAVPEPGSIALLVVGFAAMGFLRRAA